MQDKYYFMINWHRQTDRHARTHARTQQLYGWCCFIV